MVFLANFVELSSKIKDLKEQKMDENSNKVDKMTIAPHYNKFRNQYLRIFSSWTNAPIRPKLRNYCSKFLHHVFFFWTNLSTMYNHDNLRELQY